MKTKTGDVIDLVAANRLPPEQKLKLKHGAASERRGLPGQVQVQCLARGHCDKMYGCCVEPTTSDARRYTELKVERSGVHGITKIHRSQFRVCFRFPGI